MHIAHYCTFAQAVTAGLQQQWPLYRVRVQMQAGPFEIDESAESLIHISGP